MCVKSDKSGPSDPKPTSWEALPYRSNHLLPSSFTLNLLPVQVKRLLRPALYRARCTDYLLATALERVREFMTQAITTQPDREFCCTQGTRVHSEAH